MSEKDRDRLSRRFTVDFNYNSNHIEVKTLTDMKAITGISIAAIQKLLHQLIQKKYVECGEKEGSWRVFVTQ